MQKRKHLFTLPVVVLCGVASLPFLTSVLADEATSSTQTQKADNSGKNVRDRKDDAVTADHQAQGSKSDVEITREIRRAITKENSFSTNAKNVKIITEGGVVTLRGPVSNANERTKIGEIAQNCAGVTQVKNNLEVKN